MQISPIIYTRTYDCDYNLVIKPQGIPKDDLVILQKYISYANTAIDFLKGERWVVVDIFEYRLVGIVGILQDIFNNCKVLSYDVKRKSEHLFRDCSGRLIPSFIGIVIKDFKSDENSIIPTYDYFWNIFFENIEPVFDEKSCNSIEKEFDSEKYNLNSILTIKRVFDISSQKFEKFDDKKIYSSDSKSDYELFKYFVNSKEKDFSFCSNISRVDSVFRSIFKIITIPFDFNEIRKREKSIKYQEEIDEKIKREYEEEQAKKKAEREDREKKIREDIERGRKEREDREKKIKEDIERKRKEREERRKKEEEEYKKEQEKIKAEREEREREERERERKEREDKEKLDDINNNTINGDIDETIKDIDKKIRERQEARKAKEAQKEEENRKNNPFNKFVRCVKSTFKKFRIDDNDIEEDKEKLQNKSEDIAEKQGKVNQDEVSNSEKVEEKQSKTKEKTLSEEQSLSKEAENNTIKKEESKQEFSQRKKGKNIDEDILKKRSRLKRNSHQKHEETQNYLKEFARASGRANGKFGRDFENVVQSENIFQKLFAWIFGLIKKK